MKLGSGYDLIWVGSVITHLNAPPIQRLLETLTTSMKSGGRLFFSTHGDHPASMMKNGQDYGLDRGVLPKVVASYQQTGFGYADYPTSTGYGISLTSEAWLKELITTIPGLRFASHLTRGWSDHQDLVYCIRE